MQKDDLRLRRELFQTLDAAARACAPRLDSARVRSVAACVDWLRAEIAAGHERSSLAREVHSVCAEAAAALRLTRHDERRHRRSA